MKVLAFAASNSRKSINKDLIRYVFTLLPDSDVDITGRGRSEKRVISCR